MALFRILALFIFLMKSTRGVGMTEVESSALKCSIIHFTSLLRPLVQPTTYMSVYFYCCSNPFSILFEPNIANSAMHT